MRNRTPAAFLLAAVLLASLALAGCEAEPPEPAQKVEPRFAGIPPMAPMAPMAPLPDGPLFVDVTDESGLDFVHFNGMAGAFYMPENIGSGGALIDYDGDGDLDVYLVQGREIGPGATVEGATLRPRHPLPLSDRLYRSDLRDRVLRFTDVTATAGLPEALYGMGAAAGDYDGDGRVDLYVTGFGRNRLLRNVTGSDGVPRFEDVTDRAGVDDPRWSVPAVFFDYDRDGWLDLYVGNYLDFTFDTHRPCTTLAGAPDYCDPSAYGGVGDSLFHNLGSQSVDSGGVTFENVTDAAGLGGGSGAGAPAGGRGKSLGAVAFDADGDGWLDLYVANDGTPNQLWVNRGDGTFEDVALLAGCAVNEEGLAEASMGVDAEDADLDGFADLFMAHFAEETNTLYVNDGSGLFEDRSVPAGLAVPSLEANGFGTGWIDFDSDGLLDLLVVNGTVRAVPELVRSGDPYPYHQPNQLFRNLGTNLARGAGGVRFEEVTDRAGEPFERSEVSRGALIGDLDDDGDPDVVVSNSAGPARVLLDVAADGRRWIGVRALMAAPGGSGALVDALGARVGLVRHGAPTLWRRVATDGSYASAGDPRVLFGLGVPGVAGPEATAVRVRWPDGTAEDFEVPPEGTYTEVARGSGRPTGEGEVR